MGQGQWHISRSGVQAAAVLVGTSTQVCASHISFIFMYSLLERKHELISQLFWRNILILRLGRSGKWFFDVLCNVPQPFICYHDVKNGNVPPRQFTSKTLQDQINIFPIQWVLLFFSHKMLSVLANAYSYMYECCLMVEHFFLWKKNLLYFLITKILEFLHVFYSL